MLSGRGLPPQHSRGDHDIDRAKPGDHAPHGGMQHNGPKDGIVAQKIVPIPQAKPRQKQQHNSYLE